MLTRAEQRLRAASQRYPSDRVRAHAVNNALTVIMMLKDALSDAQRDGEEMPVEVLGEVPPALSRANELLGLLAA
jgi:hypothetical protein